jgi:hypothetical protein
MMILNTWKSIMCCGVAAAAAGVSAPAAAQDVRQAPNGSWSVHYPGPCLIIYDRLGRRLSDNPACNGTQRRLADQAVRARIAGPGGSGGYGYNQNYGYGEPIVRINSGGWGTVNLRNGCIVTFNRDARRINDTQPCNSNMRAYAQRIFSDRLYGGGGGYYPQGNYGRQPRLTVVGNTLRVDMTGYRCTYVYTTGGNHIQSLGNQCQSELRDVANRMVRDWRERARR